MSIDRQKLKADVIAARNYWHPFHEGLVELCPEFLAAYLAFQDGPAREGHLEPKVREFIYIAIDGAVSHLYASGLRRHIEDALRAGATKEEVLQVIMLATAAQGQLPNAKGHAILLEEMRAVAPVLSAAQQARKKASIAKTGTWPEAGDAVLATSPQFAEGFLGYGEVAWTAGPLLAKVKAFIGLAVCASPALLYEPGMRRHIRLALDHGATKEEISEVLALASAIAVHTCTYAVPALVEAVKVLSKPSA
jgi:alkylhydroperoxidase/carboxymuconolactone decarboxylase family protein YurZ